MGINASSMRLGNPWLVCGIAAAFALLQAVLQTYPSIMVPQLMRAFSIDILGCSLLSSGYFYTYLLLQIPSGILVDRLGARRVLNVAIFLVTLSCALFALADNLTVAWVARLLMGLGSAPAITVAMFLAGRWFPPTVFALAAGAMEGFGLLGGALGETLLSHVVMSDYGWRGALWLCCLIGGVLALMAQIWVCDNPYVRQITPRQNISWRKMGVLLRLVLGQPHIWLSGIYSGLMFVLVSGFASLWCVPFLQELYHVDVIYAAMMASSVFIGAATGAPFLGWCSDKLQSRRMAMYAGSLFTSILVMGLIYWPPSDPLIMVLMLLLSGFTAGTYIIPFSIARDSVPVYAQGTAMGFINMMSISIGAPIFQPLVGAMLTWTSDEFHISGVLKMQDYQIAFIMMPVCFMLAVLLVTLMRRVN